MTKEYDICALGESLIDFTPAGKSPAGMELFERNPGGAPANVLACAAKLGCRTAFLGKVGKDMHGEFLRRTMEDAGIEVRGLAETEEYFTTLAFVTLTENGERDFAFARKPGADTRLTAEELDRSLLQGTRIFHIGSLSLTEEPVRSATWAALREAKAAGAWISYDPNDRPLLWPSRELAREQIRSILPLADLVKVSREECRIVTGTEDPEMAARTILEQGASCAAVTLGAEGAWLFTREGQIRVPGCRTENVVDTTGAGDAFWGAFLTHFVKNGADAAALSLPKLEEAGRFACAAASLCVEKRGGIPAMPAEAQVWERYRRS